jgi:hypothetical protein
MRDIAKRLLGDDAAGVFDWLAADDGDGSGLAERVRRSGEWCGTIPGDGFAASVLRGGPRERRGQGEGDGRRRAR